VVSEDDLAIKMVMIQGEKGFSFATDPIGQDNGVEQVVTQKIRAFI